MQRLLDSKCLGDICKDGNIDIKDVVYLRNAIVGKYNQEGYPNGKSYPIAEEEGNAMFEYFERWGCDVDGSNNIDWTSIPSYEGVTGGIRPRNLGDIGDVIAIRQRILTGQWSDLEH